jgi:O-antigen ligase
MSTTVTADSEFFSAPRATYVFQPGVAIPRNARWPFLIFAWMAIAMGVLAMFEPSPSDIGIILLFGIGFFAGTLQWNRQLTLPFILLALFMIANLVSLCYAIDLESSAVYFGITTFMLVLWLFVLGVITKYEEQGLNTVMLAFTFGGIVSALIALLCYFNLASLGDWVLYYDRIKGFFKDPNVFGPYLVIVAVYSLHSVLKSKTVWRKGCWLLSSLVASVGMLLCYSRAAWINYAVTMLMFFGLTLYARRDRRLRRRSVIYFAIFAAIIAGAIAYAMTIPQVNQVLSYRTDIQDYDADRFATFYAALRLGFSNPLGVGPAQSFLLLSYATHNVYLRIFSENGLIGFLSFTAFVVITLTRATILSQKAMQSGQRSLFALVSAALFGTLINSFTIDTLHWRHFWLLLALGWTPVWLRADYPQPRVPLTFATPNVTDSGTCSLL